MGSFPAYKLDWAPVGTEGHPRAHVVLEHFNEGRIACGSIPLEWLTKVYSPAGALASMPLGPADECDHIPVKYSPVGDQDVQGPTPGRFDSGARGGNSAAPGVAADTYRPVGDHD